MHPSRKTTLLLLAPLALAAGVVGFSMSRSTRSEPEGDPVGSRIEAHVRELASDDYAGRAPGTRGGDAAAEYIERVLRRSGLQPAGSDGFRQPVPLQGVRTLPSTRLSWSSVNGDGGAVAVDRDAFLGGWNRAIETTDIEAGLVFVGYGLADEQQGRDDYDGTDVDGRWAVALDGAPPGQSGSLSPSAQPVAKLHAARRHGAVGLLLLSHVPAWPEPYDLAREERILPGWGRGERGQPLAWAAVRGALVDSVSAGDNLWEEAIGPHFHPRPLPGRVRLELRQEVREFEHPNLLARLPGSDPTLEDAHVCLSAHYDGLGRSGGRIYRGVVDNAVGVAELLEAARLARAEPAPRRSLLFFFPTAEEAGLLGSQYFVENPTVPLSRILGCLNKDGAPEVWGRAQDVIAVAAAASPPLRDALRDEVARRGLAWSRNPFPAEGFFFRSDHYSFLRAGVPGVLLFTGLAFEERPQAWGLERAMVYLKDHYHRTTDDLTQVLDWEGTARYARLWLDLGRALANGPELPASGIDLQVGD